MKLLIFYFQRCEHTGYNMMIYDSGSWIITMFLLSMAGSSEIKARLCIKYRKENYSVKSKYTQFPCRYWAQMHDQLHKELSWYVLQLPQSKEIMHPHVRRDMHGTKFIKQRITSVCPFLSVQLYIVTYQYSDPYQNIRRISGLYNHATKATYYVKSGVINPTTVNILCGADA